MQRKTEVIKEEQKGRYTVRHCVDGSYRVLGVTSSRNKRRDAYVPSDETLRLRYVRNMKAEGRLSLATRTFIGLRGIVFSGKRSLIQGKLALGLPLRNISSRKKVEQAVRSFWPEEQVRQFLQGEPVSLRSITAFRKSYHAFYNRAREYSGTFQAYMESLPEPYGELYAKLNKKFQMNRYQTINPDKLGKKLLQWFMQGKPISPSCLSRFSVGTEERNALYQLRVLGNHRYLGKKPGNLIKMISELTGLKPADIKMSGGARKRNATLTERLTSFALHWAQLLEMDLEGISLQEEIYTPRELRRFTKFSDGELGIADLRIGNTAIEVKTGVARFSPRDAEDVIDRYTPKRNDWETGESMDSGVVFFHQDPENYEWALQDIEKQGIKTVSHKEFHAILRQVLPAIRRQKLAARLSPRANLDYLLRYHQETLNPHLLMRYGNKTRMAWTGHLLSSLIRRAKSLRQETEQRADLQEAENLEDVVKGKTISSRFGKFFLVETPLHEIGGDAAEYVQRNRQKLFLKSIRKRFPHLSHLPKSRMAFIDLENCGFSNSDPIFMVSLAHFLRGREISIRTLIARDYGEERAMLNHLLKTLEEYEAVFTYNGSSFDLPRISERAKQNGVMTNHTRYRELTETLRGRHIDLLPICTKQFSLPDHQLKTIEKLVLGLERDGDIPSKEIPRVYRQYVYASDGTKDMVNILHHNRQDTLNLMAILIKLLSR